MRLDPIIRERFLRLIDGRPSLMGVAYEINKYRDRFKIVNKLISSKLYGENLEKYMIDSGVSNFDDSIQVSGAVNSLVLTMSKFKK